MQLGPPTIWSAGPTVRMDAPPGLDAPFELSSYWALSAAVGGVREARTAG